jgi:class 3 adenylate cyclase/pimeloyl-ACP methyl ester carboxylesterase
VEQRVRFFSAPDGARLAYATYGGGNEGGVPLVYLPSWPSQEITWSDADGRRFFEALAADRPLITIDPRGMGASSSASLAPERTLVRQHADDLLALADDLRLDQLDVFAAIESRSASAVLFAAAHPERVRRLVLWTPILESPGYPPHLVEMIQSGWNIFTRLSASILAPSAPGERLRWFTHAIRTSMPPEFVLREVTEPFGLTVVAPSVKAPTLVLRRAKDQHCALAPVKEFCASVPDATFVPLDGDVHDLTYEFEQHIDIVTSFLGRGRAQAKPAEEPTAPMRAILFTDVEGSTDLLQRLGDERAREVFREHDRITRDMLRAHGGFEVKTLGDGFMAWFPSSARAVECAVALQRAFRGDGDGVASLRVRVGVNAGEPLEHEDDLFGTAVVIAARLAALARGGQIIVADVVRQLAAGRAIDFKDLGETELKGIEAPVRHHEVAWE